MVGRPGTEMLELQPAQASQAGGVDQPPGLLPNLACRGLCIGFAGLTSTTRPGVDHTINIPAHHDPAIDLYQAPHRNDEVVGQLTVTDKSGDTQRSTGPGRLMYRGRCRLIQDRQQPGVAGSVARSHPCHPMQLGRLAYQTAAVRFAFTNPGDIGALRRGVLLDGLPS